jgi:hypothetical protein
MKTETHKESEAEIDARETAERKGVNAKHKQAAAWTEILVGLDVHFDSEVNLMPRDTDHRRRRLGEFSASVDGPYEVVLKELKTQQVTDLIAFLEHAPAFESKRDRQ